MVVLFLLAALLQEPVSGSLYGPSSLTGGLGGSVTHQCFYSITPANKYDRKFWCKIAGNGVCYTIISSTDYTSREYVGRVSLKDVPQNGTFMVTMTGLKSSDTGTYRCGIGPTRGGLSVSLNLTVVADAGVSKPIQHIQGLLHSSVTVLCPPGDTQSGGKRFWCKVGRTSCTLIADSNGYMGRNYHGRVLITPQESSGGFKILINDLKKEDSGLYRCGTGRPSGQSGPQEVILQVTTASALPRRPKFLSGTVGGSLSFKCHYDPKGSYKKKYLCRWKEGSCSVLLDDDGFVHKAYKGRIQITSSDPKHGTYTVVMSQLREGDTGWYWCRAQSGHTEHTSSVKLLIQKEICSSQDPETTTLVKPTLLSPAASRSPTQRSITDLMYVMDTITESTTMGTDTETTLLPTATTSTSGTSPGDTYLESSSGESHLLPVVLPALALLICIATAVLTLTKIKLQKKMGEGRSTIGNLEATRVQTDVNLGKEQTMEEPPSPGDVQGCKVDSGKCRKIYATLGRFRIINLYLLYREKLLFKVTDEDLSQTLL